MQYRRPEVSAATAAVVERATAKDLARRYPDIPTLLADLEEVLAIEAARAGQSTGEVTTVLRTLPAAGAPAAAVADAPPGSLAGLAGAARRPGGAHAGADRRQRPPRRLPRRGRQTGPHAGRPGTDLRARLQPVRQRTRTPDAGGQRGRRRPRNRVEHRALPRRLVRAQAGDRHLHRRGPRAARPRDRGADAHAGLHRRRVRRQAASTPAFPTKTPRASPSAAGRNWWLRARSARRARSASTPTGSRSATTCCGSPTCPRAAKRRRSRG